MSIVPNGRGECSVCGKEKITYECKGCANDFCYKHLTEHRQIFIEQLVEVDSNRDQCRTIVIQRRDDLPNHLVMQQISKWEIDAIKRIKQTAEDCRNIFMEQATACFNEIEIKLNKLNNDIIITREENEFNEIVLEALRTKLNKIVEELATAPNVTIRQDSSTFINKIYIISSTGAEISVLAQARTPSSAGVSYNSKYIQNAVTIAGGNGQGRGLNQLILPEGVFVDDDNSVYVADSGNHRILKWQYGDKNGQVVAGGNGKGNRNDQLDGPICVVVDKKSNSLIISDLGNRRVVRWPRVPNSTGQTIIPDIKCSSLAIDSIGQLYAANWKKHEVRRWKIGDKDGILVAGGNGQGNSLNQLDCPSHIFVDSDNSVYISDYSNHRVVKWLKGGREGIIIAGQKGLGSSLAQLSHPQGIAIDQFDQIYIADCDNHRVVRLSKGDTQGTIIAGGKGQGDQPQQLNTPIGIALDKQGHLYVVDSENHRVQKYQLTTN
ncbi:unnamed protein product [Adineta steineri]|uniref:Uncharacterized protein n=1 Tax=Adineta steineri TaxID=433720 RepID=A0A814NH17_9BILA|nr:unnamed protein product [Adineta steineri]CAF3917706.1 unnamed protein product [Adineta steineri]